MAIDMVDLPKMVEHCVLDRFSSTMMLSENNGGFTYRELALKGSIAMTIGDFTRKTMVHLPEEIDDPCFLKGFSDERNVISQGFSDERNVISLGKTW